MTPEARAFAGDGIRPRPGPTGDQAPRRRRRRTLAEPPAAVAALAVEPRPEPRRGPSGSAPRVVIVGGGGTGCALAHDLALRGLKVTLVERGEITSGSTGRGMGLLHSGARYALTDRVAAADCVAENKILRRIAAGSFEENEGLLVALTDAEAELEGRFLDACWQAAVPVRQVPGSRVRGIEPGLSPGVRLALQVSDATMDPMRLALRFLATARSNGAEARTFTEVVALAVGGGAVNGVRVRDHAAGTEEEIGADLVVNAAGPWAGRVAALAGVALPFELETGTMLAVHGRHANCVVGRLGEHSDAARAVPQRLQTVFGARWVRVDDPDGADGVAVASEAREALLEGAAELLPSIRGAKARATWSGVRAVFHDEAGRLPELSGEVRCFDHALDDRPVEGLVTIAGGSTTLARHIAEAAADLVCRKLAFDVRCETAETPLLPHTAWYAR